MLVSDISLLQKNVSVEDAVSFLFLFCFFKSYEVNVKFDFVFCVQSENDQRHLTPRQPQQGSPDHNTPSLSTVYSTDSEEECVPSHTHTHTPAELRWTRAHRRGFHLALSFDSSEYF